MTTNNKPALQPPDELCPWCKKKPQRYRVPANNPNDPCGGLVERIRCVTYQCPLNCVDMKPEDWNSRVRVVDGGVAENWFDLALRYLRGDPELTDVPYSSDSVFAAFLRFWDAQTPHFRSVIKSVFQVAAQFSTAAAAAPVAAPQDEQERHWTPADPPVRRIKVDVASSQSPAIKAAEDQKMVYSKDVMEALDKTFDSLGRQKLPVSEVGFAVYRGLAKVPEFYANGVESVEQTETSAKAED